ncbi:MULTISPECIES: aldehyde dehydrogenase family protein [unclassified Frankia]|uniref:aldehyde dehydrogenase family protein n=1 Tax=unclassified Frankia TaxID=2632575 RepID=UPI001EF4438C|nr:MULTISPECIES: aldehyde dehydrogenase family protein [unclassified Frankia]
MTRKSADSGPATSDGRICAGRPGTSRHFGSFYIDGQWTTPLSETTTPIIEAATEQRLGDLPEAGAKEVDLAVAAARAAQPAWDATPAVERAGLLERLAGAVERRSKQISEIVSRQNGMPLALSASASANVRAVAGTLRYYAALARGGFADQERPALAYPGTVRLQRRPVGTVAVIVPWNYPLGLTAMKLGPALAAGCTVVLKPAPETSLDAAYLMEAIEEAGIPAGVVNLITGGRQTGDLLIRHPGIDKVSFTGSTAAGRIISKSSSPPIRSRTSTGR